MPLIERLGKLYGHRLKPVFRQAFMADSESRTGLAQHVYRGVAIVSRFFLTESFHHAVFVGFTACYCRLCYGKSHHMQLLSK